MPFSDLISILTERGFRTPSAISYPKYSSRNRRVAALWSRQLGLQAGAIGGVIIGNGTHIACVLSACVSSCEYILEINPSIINPRSKKPLLRNLKHC